MQIKIGFVLFISIILCSLSLFAESRPNIEPLNTPWDFGQIDKGEVVKKTFTISNIGDKRLTIEGVRSCCGYSMLKLSSWVIAPNESASITISCNSEFKNPGIDKKYFTIKSNDPIKPELKIPLSSYIVE